MVRRSVGFICGIRVRSRCLLRGRSSQLGFLGKLRGPLFFGITLRSFGLERPEASLFQIGEPLQFVAGSFEAQREGVVHDSHAAYQFSAHVAHGAEDVSYSGPWCGDPAVTLFLRL